MWLVALIAPALWQRTFSTSSLEPDITQPVIFFAMQLAGGSVGLLSCLLLAAHAQRFGQIELGYLAAFCAPLSLLTLVRGLVVPGLYVETSEGFLAAGFWAIPISLLASSPILLTSGRLRDIIDGRWPRWAWGFFVAALAIAAVAILKPALIPVWDGETTMARIVVGISVLGTWLYSARHLQLAMIANSAKPLLVALGFGAIGASALMWLSETSFTTGLWTAQLLSIAGVFFVALGSLVAYRSTTKLDQYLRPIIEIDPRRALGIGLAPIVSQYFESLEKGSPITKDHVLGTTELAMKIGDRLDFSQKDLRDLGLAALLHDVGQLSLPEELIGRSTPLNPHEALMQEQHAGLGAEMLSESSPLASIAPIVHAHHERIDGTGYPLGLVGSQIPIAARVLSVCDAYDALSRTHDNANNHSVEPTLTLLEQHVKSRWDRRVVEVLARYVRANPPEADPNGIGPWGDIGCDCVPVDAYSPHIDAM